MKIIDLLNKIANGEEVPKEIKYHNIRYFWCNQCKTYERIENGSKDLYNDLDSLNDEVEILDDEEKKFTKEDFIKERIDLDGITREQFDERYEVKECNCGMPYCKGFRAIEKKEKGLPEKLEFLRSIEYGEEILTAPSDKMVINKINDIIDYLEKQRKGDE